MIEDEVELETEPQVGGFLQVGGRDEFVVRVVVDDGETTVQVAVEKRGQNVKQGKSILKERVGEQLHRVCQCTADAVRVSVEYHPVER